MTAKTSASLFVGVGLLLLVVAIVCRFIITAKASKAGIPRSFWLEKVDFPGRQAVVIILGLALVLGLAAMIMGFVYTAKANKEKKAAQAAQTQPK